MAFRKVSYLIPSCDGCGLAWSFGDPACEDGIPPHFASRAAARAQLPADYGWQVTWLSVGPGLMVCRRCAAAGVIPVTAGRAWLLAGGGLDPAPGAVRADPPPAPARPGTWPPGVDDRCLARRAGRPADGAGHRDLPGPAMSPRQPGTRRRTAPVRADAAPLPLHLRPGFAADAPAGRASGRVIHLGAHADRSGLWLRNAVAGLGVLAAAAAVVSFTAQYRMIFAARRLALVAGLEAAIPDAAALVFASLGIALALHGRRALRARALNVASVAVSVFMNAIAAAPGWRALAIWVMPPVAYALASDTLIGVVRAWVIARHKALDVRLADEQVTPLAVLGGLLLWLLRLALAPGSTLAGFRRWVIEECPVAPGRRLATRRPVAAISGPARRRARRGPRGGTKTARFLALVAERHGPLAAVPVTDVSRICTALAPEIGLHPGAARAALRQAVLAGQNGSRS